MRGCRQRSGRDGRARLFCSPRASRCAFTVALACALCACSNDLADLISDVARDSGATTGAQPELTEPPWLPALPDEDSRVACEACAKENCATARSNCLKDDACTALLRCKGEECDDPGCLQTCEAELGFSPWYADLWACVMNESCPAECKAGENWGCVGDYDWPAATEGRFAVTYRFENPRTSAFLGGDNRVEPFWAGAEARTCVQDSSDCVLTDVLDSGRVDASDSVELEVAIPGFARSFTGALELEFSDFVPFGLGERYLGPPLARPMAVKVFLADGSFLQGASGGAIDLDRGAPLTTTISDCLGAAARGISAELLDLPEVEILHALESGWGEGPTSRGFAFVTDVPESQRERVRVRAVRADNNETVAEREALVRAGWTTHMVLWPLTR